MSIVYYAINPPENKNDSLSSFDLLTNDLVLALRDLKNNLGTYEKGLPFYKCKSFLNATKNMYVYKNPIELDVNVKNNILINNNDQRLNSLYLLKKQNIDSKNTLDYALSYLFFSEDDIEVEITSPYMHKTSFTNSGFIMPASFNIHKWFRPVHAVLQLFENKDNIILKKDEALMYINFKTDKKINLQKFLLTEEIKQIMTNNLEYKQKDSGKSLSFLYNMFNKSDLQTKLLKLIKENLI
jgi:hypothetical protein